ncbi:740_t:CDS:2 [Acaulospora morrowiae]|uniref:740_t:CDS:1 n=1 Tax=Acaulospora morrowiae TaxID=94023 RepID=A0A9N9N526_9GLOM|nr:740_t:CDS:2 [Acaulospora morrowiae]
MSSLENGVETIRPKIANLSPLGLTSLALAMFILSIQNIGYVQISVFISGSTLIYSGISQSLASIWEYRTGNTFAATVFSSYGGFFFLSAFIESKSISFLATGYDKDFDYGLGVYLAGWALFSLILSLVTFRSNKSLFALFFFMWLTLMLFSISKFIPPHNIPGKDDLGIFFFPKKVNVNGATTCGGIFGIITALIAWYNAFTGLLNKESSHSSIHASDLGGKHK